MCSQIPRLMQIFAEILKDDKQLKPITRNIVCDFIKKLAEKLFTMKCEVLKKCSEWPELNQLKENNFRPKIFYG